MKRLLFILKGVSSVGTAVTAYLCVMRAVRNEKDMLPYVLAALFAAAFTVSLFVLSSLAGRVASLEETVRSLYDGDDAEHEACVPQKKCPVCHSYYDGDEDVCPYCKGHGILPEEEAERFATEDPDYTGTDFSEEEYVSAYTSIDGNGNGEKI